MGGPSWDCPPSETFWANQGVYEIDEQADRNDRTQYIVEDHDGRSSQTIAGERIEHERSEEEAADHKIGDIEHGKTPGDSIGFLDGGLFRQATETVSARLPQVAVQIAGRI
jgi:hypothetical protein